MKSLLTRRNDCASRSAERAKALDCDIGFGGRI